MGERTVRWGDTGVYREWIETRSGLDFLAAMVDGTLPNPPFFELLGFRVAAVSDGSVTLQGLAGEHLYQAGAIVSGGYAATLVDTATALAVRSCLPAGQRITSVEVKVHFIRPLLGDSGEITCTGTVTHRGRRISVAEARVTLPDGKLVSSGSASIIAL